MPLYKARHGKDKDGGVIYGAPFAYEPKNPEGPAAENAAAKVEAGLWVEIEPAEKPLEKRTAGDLKAYATEHDIDLGDAKTKAEILAAIVAAETKQD
ncbi:hypothetical protein [Oerskovia sp. Root22]|uniref:hypothetical protein n=1 Tax=Oerskovia sp. Root22 TaxID=1736494 RepID=UPI0006FBFFDB|nr:hypothetical protein [Oerskovia sp. Root22]KRC37519.1 hypothetical protein ASE15_05240 [Oerskovia sp. Root22]